MKKLILLLTAIACAVALVVVAVYAEQDKDKFVLAGEYFRDGKAAENALFTNSDSSDIVAEYGEYKLSRNVVDYYKNMYSLMNSNSGIEQTANLNTDVAIIESLVKNIILKEEAERRGLAATEAEIEDMVQSSMQAYALPDGKEVIDSYCAAAGLSVEEYFELIREQAPRTIARQKLKDEIGRLYCESHGIEFTKVNQPEEMRQYVEDHLNSLFDAYKDDIVYHLEGITAKN